ncbi:MAG TPA: aspartyl/asparaginyl beta-hydroxylase domain-containing protein [Candidatus Margulisiibacteriota bacterium]|nr:aspartyl/asparaginyl beta-hydroxylase domain-containing protein [Candidatus Margulisiibacteriota bacterium]
MARPLAASLPVPSDPPPPGGVLRYLGLDGCVRLPLTVDAPRLAAEIDCLPAETWGQASRDPVVQASVESFFVIGYPRGPRPVPPDDRPVLAHLPCLRQLLRDTIAAAPTRAIVARLLPGGFIPLHTDTPRFFRGTLRLSIQVSAEGVQRLYCNGMWYDMAPGEVWALDNLRPHAISNAGARPRLNVLVDYVPSAPLVDLIAAGQADLGAVDAAAQEAIESMSRAHYRKNRWRSARYELFKLLWRRG